MDDTKASLLLTRPFNANNSNNNDNNGSPSKSSTNIQQGNGILGDVRQKFRYCPNLYNIISTFKAQANRGRVHIETFEAILVDNHLLLRESELQYCLKRYNL